MAFQKMFKAIAWPDASKGESFEGQPVLVVPNQSLSLQDIIERFTRGEAVPVGNDVNFHDSDDDIEKIRHMDLVDREEFMNSLERIQERYKEFEQRKAKEQAEKIAAETRAKIEAETRAKVAAEKGQQI